MNPLRTLIVDDSALIRQILRDWFNAEDDIEVVGEARNGEDAIAKAIALRPDAITLDVEMPRMDGIGALERIMREAPTAVLMVSSVTEKGAALTLKALELGAVDFVTKPGGSGGSAFQRARSEVLSKVRALRNARPGLVARPRLPRPAALGRGASDRVVLIASSTGGPRALATVFEGLPKGFPAPVVIVQHMPAGFTASFAKRLDAIGSMPCKEAADGDRITAGVAYVAPGGSHLVVGMNKTLRLDERPPLHGVRPAADYLFMSAARQFGGRCVGCVLTGMGRDGAAGAALVRELGGWVVGEDEASCVVYGMPRAAKEAGGVDLEVPLERVADELTASLAKEERRAAV